MFADVLKTLRKNAKLSQAELAAKLRVSTSTIGMYETGKRMPDVDTVQMISKFFDVSIDYLIGTTDTKTTTAPTQKEQEEHDTFMKNLEVHFMGASEKDRDKIYSDISRLYWKYKDEN